jgi:MarR family transcriptional regulator, organic hydroperoxide resistance regulator
VSSDAQLNAELGTDRHDQARSRWTAPDSPSSSPGFQLWLVTLAWQRAIAAALQPHGLTHVQFVLLAGTWWLAEHGGPPTQRRLADHAGTNPMMTSQVLRRLEANGLVARISDAVDTRAKRVEVTACGHAVLRKAIVDVDATDADFFAPVPRSDLLQILTRLGQDKGAR